MVSKIGEELDRSTFWQVELRGAEEGEAWEISVQFAESKKGKAGSDKK